MSTLFVSFKAKKEENLCNNPSGQKQEIPDRKREVLDQKGEG